MRLMIAVEVVPANEEREKKKRLIITMICKTNQLPLVLVVVLVVVSPGLGSVVVQRLKTTPHWLCVHERSRGLKWIKM